MRSKTSLKWAENDPCLWSAFISLRKWLFSETSVFSLFSRWNSGTDQTFSKFPQQNCSFIFSPFLLDCCKTSERIGNCYSQSTFLSFLTDLTYLTYLSYLTYLPNLFKTLGTEVLNFKLYPSVHGLINYVDTKAKCRNLKKFTWQGTLRQVFIRDYRLGYSLSCWYFWPSFVNCCSSNLLSGSSSPPPFPCVKV